MIANRKDTATVRGVVERRLFDGNKLAEVRKYLRDNHVTDTRLIERMLKSAAKPQFANNGLWKAIKGVTGLDIRVPFLTGRYTLDAIRHNTVTAVGKKAIADQIGGTTTAPMTAIAIGIGTPGTTALGSESTTNGAARGAATVTNTTTTTTGDTEQWVKTFTFTGSFAITEEGIFNSNTSGGIMLASQSFAAVNVANGDSLQITHKLQVS